MEFLAAEEVGETSNGDVGFDEGGEDDGEDLRKIERAMSASRDVTVLERETHGERETEHREQGDGREDNLRRQRLARDGREESKSRESDEERSKGPEEVGSRREVTHLAQHDEFLVVTNVEETLSERVLPGVAAKEKQRRSATNERGTGKAEYAQLDRTDVAQDLGHDGSTLILVLHLLTLQLCLNASNRSRQGHAENHDRNSDEHGPTEQAAMA